MSDISAEFSNDENFMTSEDDWFARHRKLLQLSLHEVAAEVGKSLAEAGLSMQVFFTIPTSGQSLLTFATPGDPAEDEWSQVSEIVLKIISRKIGVAGLRGRNLPCIATGGVMSTADVSSLTSDRVHPSV